MTGCSSAIADVRFENGVRCSLKVRFYCFLMRLGACSPISILTFGLPSLFYTHCQGRRDGDIRMRYIVCLRMALGSDFFRDVNGRRNRAVGEPHKEE